ncbi:TetR/AcrR family transcriptional regulator [Agrobacterium sp. Azo12]|uniref:TetR/AcrR family transcriptional regulator n=1 Tax=Agrobacterium sp. Azo12 TaxID=3031129 RepID=UPI0023D87D2B|nr:TetR/AcrR family transcriptional regulator [Agrobacterium sp. Azo12]MDO5894409.1 TetR/AcrR family transcriptional regulator [Agrobacterium sp. Azo12]
MGRKKTIDREIILNAAEDIVRSRGAAALTIDALAKSLGVTKGGIQYSFASKDAIIDAMVSRWFVTYDQKFQEIAGEAPDPQAKVWAHVEATRQADEPANYKAAGLMAALMLSPEYLASTKKWYESRTEGLDVTTLEGRAARLAFLATEGAFALRWFGLMDISDDEWASIFADIKTVLNKEPKVS